MATMNAERRRQIRAWYEDPVRKLPRKVVNDVNDLLDALEFGHCHGDSCAREMLEHEPINLEAAIRSLDESSVVRRK